LVDHPEELIESDISDISDGEIGDAKADAQDGPGATIMWFGKHAGKRFDELSSYYLNGMLNRYHEYPEDEEVTPSDQSYRRGANLTVNDQMARRLG
jgi:hypothetical protein